MSLSLKDLIATILAVASGGVLYIQTKGLNVPFLSSNRLATLALLILGAAMCAVGNTSPEKPFSKSSGSMYTFLSLLGAMALISGLWGLITGSQLMIVVLGTITLAMWIITTLRHAFTRPAIKQTI